MESGDYPTVGPRALSTFHIECADCGGQPRVEVYVPPQMPEGGFRLGGREFKMADIRALMARMHG